MYTFRNFLELPSAVRFASREVAAGNRVGRIPASQPDLDSVLGLYTDSGRLIGGFDLISETSIPADTGISVGFVEARQSIYRRVNEIRAYAVESKAKYRGWS